MASKLTSHNEQIQLQRDEYQYLFDSFGLV